MAGIKDPWEEPRRLHRPEDTPTEDADGVREVERLLRGLFDKCRDRCVWQDARCGVRAGTRPLSSDMTPHCQFPTCEVCEVFSAQPQDLYTQAKLQKNRRLNQLLCLCRPFSALYRLAKSTRTPGMGSREADLHVRDVEETLCALAQCQLNRLNCLTNVGELAEIAPRLLCVQLSGGHSDFWTQMRALAKAVNKQLGIYSKLAALAIIRKCIPPGNAWSYYLQVHERHREDERKMMQEWTQAVAAESRRQAGRS